MLSPKSTGGTDSAASLAAFDTETDSLVSEFYSRDMKYCPECELSSISLSCIVKRYDRLTENTGQDNDGFCPYFPTVRRSWLVCTTSYSLFTLESFTVISGVRTLARRPQARRDTSPPVTSPPDTSPPQGGHKPARGWSKARQTMN